MVNQLLEVKGLNVFYGDVQVLWNFSLQVEEGSIVALVGTNGAGKSTFLKTISGLIRANSGQVLLSGQPLNDLTPQAIVEQGVIHVPEGRRLFSSLTVMENIKLGAYIHHARRDFEESLNRVFDLFPLLRERKHQKAGSLSGGEQQMLAIGRALMCQPKLLMLDEPSLGLSPLLVHKIFELIGELNKQKVTVLLVEQNVRQALKIAHQAFVIKNGKIVMNGRGDDLLEDEEIRQAYLGKVINSNKGVGM